MHHVCSSNNLVKSIHNPSQLTSLWQAGAKEPQVDHTHKRHRDSNYINWEWFNVRQEIPTEVASRLHFWPHVLQTCTIFQTIFFAILSYTVASSHTNTQKDTLEFLMQNWIVRHAEASLLTSRWTTKTSSWCHLSIAPCMVCDPVFTCWGCASHSLKRPYRNLLNVRGNKLSKTHTHT